MLEQLTIPKTGPERVHLPHCAARRGLFVRWLCLPDLRPEPALGGLLLDTFRAVIHHRRAGAF